MRAFVISLVFAASGSATAAPCVAAVTLTGDHALIATLHDLLDKRGIKIDPVPEPSCQPIKVRVDRRGDALVVGFDGPDGTSIERTVNGVAMAASLIESWVRNDFMAPLLEAHKIPREPELRDPEPKVNQKRALGEVQKRALGEVHKYDLDLFASGETSFGLDRTKWFGAQVGACFNLGPVCAATRLRFAAVEEGPGGWGSVLKRRGIDLLVGVDVPLDLHFHHFRLTTGFGAGFGSTHTYMDDVMHVGSQSSGLRLDGHATLTIPLIGHLSFEFSVTGNLTQETDVESSGSSIELPDEPRALLRFGVGVRYGGL